MLKKLLDIRLAARKRIDELFKQAYSGKVRAQDLHKELNDWDLFDEYQDQFFSIFK